MEAVIIIEFHTQLRKLTDAQLLWLPSTSGLDYRSNVKLGSTPHKAAAMVAGLYGDQELIRLTFHNDYVYFT